MFGRKFHVLVVGALTLLTLSLPIVPEVPRLLAKPPVVVVQFEWLARHIALTDRHLLWLRICGALFVVVLTIVVQYRQVYRPFVRFEQLRGGAFDHIFGPEIDKLRRTLSRDLRFNVMQRTTLVHISRHIHVGRLRQVYHYGYHHKHIDKSLRFWYVSLFGKTWSEGVAATAFLSEQAMIADLRDPNGTQGRLRGRKRLLMRDLKMVMSFPVIRWTGDRYTCLGTINIDISDPSVVDALFVGDGAMRRLTKLAQYLQDCTEYVSLWL